MAELSPSNAPPQPDERRKLLLRGGGALVVIGALLVVLWVWERNQTEAPPAPQVRAVVPTPEQIRAASGEAAPAAQSAAMPAGEASAPQSADSMSAAQSEPATQDIAEETRGVEVIETLPSPPTPARQAEPIVAEGTAGRSRAPAAAEPTPSVAAPARLVVQTEPAPPGVKPPAGRAFALQAGVFSTPKNAEDLRARLELAGIPAQLETRVVVGPFNTRQDAEKAQNKLKALGLARGQLVTVKLP
ncbi:SPOR domain-containing protein [Niveibacterium sp. 24ML]|uniref:SPOR domain-containing protein n=1 Tax=Niveibacterium sp. 24ML TaxID=2985512 RepID=UPI00226F32E5|nr:SPOR domain-containing protein [Niveibacterium sp. 24ML]MCX9156894.1 SPOR domain-containing protein [Niveibacterium sp. 24ML]